MGTLTGLMSLSRAALDADQSAINTTANNVANQNTAGYTREVTSFEASDAVSLSGFGGLGETVSATAVSQRSRVLEQQLQQQTQGATQASTRLSALQSVESMFGLSATSTNASSTAIGSAVDGFFSSLTALSSNPTNAATQAAVLSAAQTLAAAFHTTSQGMSSQIGQLNSGIASAAQGVNGLTTQVAQLNAQIAELRPNEDAGTLEDSRQQAILQLSSILGVDQITTQGNGVTLTASDGTVLVSGTTAYPLSTTTVSGTTEIVAGEPPTTLSKDVQGGTIGGMLQARDVDIPPMQASMDQLAYAIGTAVNTQNAAGTTAAGVAGGAVFTVGAGVSGAAGAISVAITSASGIATAGVGEGNAGDVECAGTGGFGDGECCGWADGIGVLCGVCGDVGERGVDG